MRIRGIPLRIHPSWFLILALATVAFQQQYSQQFAAQTQEPWLWAIGLLTALLLFLSVLLHELGHTLEVHLDNYARFMPNSTSDLYAARNSRLKVA